MPCPQHSHPFLPIRYLFRSSVIKVSFVEHGTGLGLFLDSNFICSKISGGVFRLLLPCKPLSGPSANSMSLLSSFSISHCNSGFFFSFLRSDFSCLFPNPKPFTSFFSALILETSTFLLLRAGSLLLRKPNQLAKEGPGFGFASTEVDFVCTWPFSTFS